MALQFDVLTRNAILDVIESHIGVSPTLEIRSGPPPANCAAADTGTLLASMVLPSDWMAAAASGSKALLGTWQDASADATGVAGHYRIKAASVTKHQGTVGSNVAISTNAALAANGNVLPFASTTGVSVGQLITGTGVLPGTFVLAFTGTTVTMSQASTAGVGSGVSITFSGDMTIDNTSIAITQQVNVTAFNLTAPGA
jgi:hypothetical protein